MSLEHDSREPDETPTCSGLPADDDVAHREWIDDVRRNDEAGEYEPLPVLKPITAQVRRLDPAAWERETA